MRSTAQAAAGQNLPLMQRDKNIQN